jgi:hypothetical protein
VTRLRPRDTRHRSAHRLEQSGRTSPRMVSTPHRWNFQQAQHATRQRPNREELKSRGGR